MCRVPQHLAVWLLLALVSAAQAQAPGPALTVDAPASLAGTARRVEGVNFQRLGEALERAGLELPSRVHVLLVEDQHSLAQATPHWVVGLASGRTDIAIFPGRVVSYPYDSLESVVRHEVVHLALTARADGRPLPRWFHEGVAVSVDAGFGVGSQLRLLGAMIRRPALDDVSRLFTTMTRPDATDAYLLSAALVEDVRQRHGAAVPGAIAARVALGVPFARAFELETGETPEDAAARTWASYSRWTTWVAAVTSGSAMWVFIMGLAFLAYVARARRRRRRRRQWDEEEAEW